MCSSWYFPRFLLRVGSWTCMNMASLMVLDLLLTSFCTILNCSGSTGCPRTIKEAMFIHVQDPTLNRNLGKYQLQYIWGHLLVASPTQQCKPSSLPTPPPPTGSPPSCCPSRWGHILFLVSTHARPNTTPYTPKHPQNTKTTPLQQCHLGKFSFFIC